MPIEVKYQKKIEISDFNLMNKVGFKRGIIVSKEAFLYKRGFMVVPLEIFLMKMR